MHAGGEKWAMGGEKWASPVGRSGPCGKTWAKSNEREKINDKHRNAMHLLRKTTCGLLTRENGSIDKENRQPCTVFIELNS